MEDFPPCQFEPTAYVCVVSGFNLPNLEACLARKPADVLLLVSQGRGIADAAVRLRGQLERLLPGIRVQALGVGEGDAELHGDGLIECQRWVLEVLMPRLRRSDLADKQHVLNLTGGTKAMTAALLGSHAWTQFDYKAEGRNRLEVFEVDPTAAHRGGRYRALAPMTLPDVQPLDVARLHANYVKPAPINPLADTVHDESITLAAAIWQAQVEDDPALKQIFRGLEAVWSDRENRAWAKPRIEQPWADFLATQEAVGAPSAAVRQWLARCQRLAPEALSWSDTVIRFPGNKPRKGSSAEHLRDWISGDWLEQLAYHWLLGATLPPNAIARNVISGSDARASGGHKETDIITHHHNRTTLVEIKAGLPPNHAPSELENQVSALGSRFGRTDKALLIGPQLLRQLGQDKRLDTFELRCKASQVQLITDERALIEFALGASQR